MKKAMFILPVMMAFTLSGCALLDNIFKKNSSNGSQTSQQGSGSGSQQSGSQSQSGGGASKATLTITKANSEIGTTDGLTSAKQVTFSTDAGNVVIEWGSGSYNYKNYDEIGIAKNGGYFKLVSLPTSYKVSKLVLDCYKAENSKVYKTNDGSGSPASPSQTGSSSNKDSVLVTYDNFDSATFYVGNPSTEYAQAFYSIVIDISK